jgi:hypothetical protein
VISPRGDSPIQANFESIKNEGIHEPCDCSWQLLRIRRARDEQAMAIPFVEKVWLHDDLESRLPALECIRMDEQALILSMREIESL